MPTVSLIVPAYNAEATLPRCLESALAQTFADFELIAVDDGSTDGTAALLARYAERDARVRVLRTANGGVSRARNLALSQARGAYWMFLDADDALEPTAMAALLDATRTPSVLMAAGADAKVDAQGQTLEAPSIGEARTYAAAEAAEAMLAGAPFDGTLHAKLLRACDARFAEDVHIYEDMLFLLEALDRPGEVAYLPMPLHRYYLQPESAMGWRLTRKKASSLLACERLEALAQRSFPGALMTARRFRLTDALLLLQRIAEVPVAMRREPWARAAREEARRALLADPSFALGQAGFTRSQRLLYRALQAGWPAFLAAYRGGYLPLRRLARG